MRSDCGANGAQPLGVRAVSAARDGGGMRRSRTPEPQDAPDPAVVDLVTQTWRDRIAATNRAAPANPLLALMEGHPHMDTLVVADVVADLRISACSVELSTVIVAHLNRYRTALMEASIANSENRLTRIVVEYDRSITARTAVSAPIITAENAEAVCAAMIDDFVRSLLDHRRLLDLRVN